jgi:hypothetical protein
MNVFCTLLGHTWITVADTPKTAWNNDDAGQLLYAKPSGDPRFFEECVRCRRRRPVTPPQVGRKVASG